MLIRPAEVPARRREDVSEMQRVVTGWLKIRDKWGMQM
jgi:hypothetical protein